MKRLALAVAVGTCALVLALRAQQELPPPEAATLGGEAAGLDYTVQLPAGFAADSFRPVVLLLGVAPTDAADRDRRLQLMREIARKGMVVVAPDAVSLVPGPGAVVMQRGEFLRLPAQLRRRFRIAQGGLHLVAIGNVGAPTIDLATAAPWEFQTVSSFGGEREYGSDVLARLPGRRIFWFTDQAPGPTPAPTAAPRSGVPPLRTALVRRPAVPFEKLADAVPEHLAKLHAERDLAGPAGEVARALDDFHDAAGKGDAERYFALLPDDSVFLGTDGSERWDGVQFRAFAMPYFRRGSAWTFVPIVRHVEVGAGATFAWFDEQLDNEAYGECRGSGVLERREGRWVVRQYNLVIPVPNDLARGLVARIRDFAQGLTPAATTVVIVRHAEKGEGQDPALTAAGEARAERLAAAVADVDLAAVFTSQYRRTQATVAPLCRAKGLEARVVPAADAAALARAVHEHGARRAVLVAAHSDTIPAIVKALGVVQGVEVAADDFGSLFVVTLSVDGARLLRLRY